MAIPDFIDLALDRLQINIKEIAGMKRVFRSAPVDALDINDSPAAILRAGRKTNYTPRGQGGRIRTTREFYADLLGFPLDSSEEVGDLGIEAITKIYPFLHLFEEYFTDHPRLDTDGTNIAMLGPLAYLDQDVHIIDIGPAKVQAPGGAMYSGTVFTFTLEFFGLARRIS